MSFLALLDPSIGTANTGDRVISQAATLQLQKCFPHHSFRYIQTRHRLTRLEKKQLQKAVRKIFLGTNILVSKMREYHQWKLAYNDVLAVRNTILMGVGWWQYQGDVDWITKNFWRFVLSSNSYHSVRDSFTAEKLASIGITNVLNTGCPTMWSLSVQKQYQIPTTKSSDVVCTLTDYNRDPVKDAEFLACLKNKYKQVYFWPQGKSDRDYFRKVHIEGVKFLGENLEDFDQILRCHNDIDYIGTRLHGAIRALNASRRACVVCIDNRAQEIAYDTGLPIVQRGDREQLEDWIFACRRTELTIPWANISKWCSQFLK